MDRAHTHTPARTTPHDFAIRDSQPLGDPGFALLQVIAPSVRTDTHTKPTSWAFLRKLVRSLPTYVLPRVILPAQISHTLFALWGANVGVNVQRDGEDNDFMPSRRIIPGGGGV